MLESLMREFIELRESQLSGNQSRDIQDRINTVLIAIRDEIGQLLGETMYNTGLTEHQLKAIASLICGDAYCTECVLKTHCRAQGELLVDKISEELAITIERWAADYPERVDEITSRYRV
jgi:hypothetical protein